MRVWIKKEEKEERRESIHIPGSRDMGWDGMRWKQHVTVENSTCLTLRAGLYHIPPACTTDSRIHV
jgi:hypothetical protein